MMNLENSDRIIGDKNYTQYFYIIKSLSLKKLKYSENLENNKNKFNKKLIK